MIVPEDVLIQARIRTVVLGSLRQEKACISLNWTNRH